MNTPRANCRLHVRKSTAEPLESRITPASFTWINPASGAWATAANWSVVGVDADGIPDADDDVTINPVAAGLIVTVSTGAQTANTISIPGDDVLAITGGSLTLGADSTINSLTLSGGTLNAGPQLTLTGSSSLSGNATINGTLRNEGSVSVANEPNIGGTLDNVGSIEITGRVDFTGSGRMNNLAAGVVTLANPAGGNVLSGAGTVPGFFNGGMLRHTVETTSTVAVPYTNLESGIVEANAGTLRFAHTSSWQGADFRIAADANIIFDTSSATFAGLFVGSGGGKLSFGGGIQGASEGVKFFLSATVGFPAGFFEIASNATLMPGSTVTNAGVLTIEGFPDIQGTINNVGTIFQNARIDFGPDGQINNLPGGVYEVHDGRNGALAAGTASQVRYTNAGTFRYTASGTNTVGVPFNNMPGGVIEGMSGSLHFNRAGTWGDTHFQVSPGAEVAFIGGANIGAEGAWTGFGGGIVRLGGGTQGASEGAVITAGPGGARLNFPAGMFEFSDNATITAGGTIHNLGFMRIPVGSPDLEGRLDNAGTIIATTRLELHGTATVNNLPTGTFEFAQAGGGTILSGATSQGFNNAGTLRLAEAGTSTVSARFHNLATGVIEVAAGTLALHSNGTWQGANFLVSPGSLLTLNAGTKTWTGTFTGSGGGIVRLGGGTQGASAGGTVTIGSGGATLNMIDVVFDFSGNSNLNGATLINLGNITAEGRPNLATTIENHGSIVNIGTIDLGTGARIHNKPGGVYEIVRDTNAGHVSGTGMAPAFLNEGLILKTGIGTATGGSVSNTGTIRVEEGTLSIPSLVQLSAGTLSAGTYVVSAGATLTLPANVTTNQATVELHGASTQLNAIRNNQGTLRLGREFNSTTAFTNQGILELAPGGRLSVTGALNFGFDSITEFEIGGTGDAEYGRITATGAATFGGSARITMVNGFEAGAGDSFALAAFASKTGQFFKVEGLLLNRDLNDPAFETVLSATDFRLLSLKNAADLSVTAITVPASGLAGQNFTFSYTVENLSAFATTAGAWLDSIYLSLDDSYDVNDRLLVRFTHTGDLAPGGTYTENLNVPLPGVIPEDYRLIVVADSRGFVPDASRANNSVASTGQFAVDIPALTDGLPINGTIANGQELYFKLTLPAGKTPSFTFSGAVAGQAEIYSSLGNVPTRSSYEEAAFDPTRANQTTTHETNSAATYYVMVRGRENAGDGQSFSILGDGLDLGVTGLGTAGGANVGQVTIRIDGTLFTAGTTFSLVPAGGGTPIPAGQVVVQSASTAFATFQLAGVTPGIYSVLASDGGANDTLLNAFTVTAGQIRPAFGGISASGSTEGQLVYDITSPSFIRPPFRGTVAILTYKNVGGSDIPAPLFNVFSENARIRLADEVGYSIGSMELLGVNPNGLAGILSPGASGSIEIYFEPIDGSPNSEVKFQVQVANNSELPIDWDVLKDDLRPTGLSGEAWDPIFANFKVGVGGTLGSYHEALIDNANYLSRFGKVSPDVGRLFQFELEQADNFGEISGNYVHGAFGFGKAGPFSTRAITEPNGNVTIVEGHSVRGFVPLGGGKYRGVGAELGTLTLANGVLTLDEGDGNKVSFRADGRIDFLEDANGRRHIATWNASGQLTAVTDDQTGDQIAFSYNAAGLIATSTDPVGRVTTYSYDAEGNNTSITTPQGTTTFAYFTAADGAAKNHALKSITGPDGVTTTFTYDAHGRSASQTIGTGPNAMTSTLSYDSAGRASETDSNGNTFHTFRGPGGYVLRTVDPTGAFVSSNYDANGRLLSTRDGAGLIFSATHDDTGLTGFANGARGTTTFDFDGDVRRLQSFTDPGGDTTHFTYDAQGNLLRATQPDGFSERYEYDARGRVVATYNASGERISYEYDDKNLLARVVLPDGSNIDYTYDAHRNLLTAANAGGVTTFTYDSADRVTSVSYPNGKTVAITYDAAGRRSTVSDGVFTARYAYDALGRLDTVHDTSNALVVDYDRNALGQLVKETRGNGATTTYSYDNAGRIQNVTHRDATNAVTDFFTYGYDGRGRVTTVTTPDGTTTYAYDAAGQLSIATLPDRTITFAYDAEGNRTVVSDTLAGSTAYTTNVTDQYTAAGGTTYTYDREGRVTSSQTGGVTTTYQYDASGRLTQLTKPGESIQYDYDALGNRIGVLKNGVRTDFALDPTGLGQVFGEYSSEGSANYVNGLGIAARVSGSAALYYHFDARGNTALLSGSGGAAEATYEYLPFGEISAQTGSATNPFTYNGRLGVQDDAGDLFYMRARYYDADSGRFTTRDPIGLLGTDTNFYRYVNNDPINFSDPSGLIPATAAGVIVPTTGLGTVSTTSAAYLGATETAAFTAANGALTAGGGATVATTGGVTLGSGLAIAAAEGYVVYETTDYLHQKLDPEGSRGQADFYDARYDMTPDYDGSIYDDMSHVDNDYNRFVKKNGQDQLINSVYQSLIRSGGYDPDEALLRARELVKNYRGEQPEDQPDDETSSRTVRPSDPNNIVGPRGPLADPVPVEPAPGQVRFDGWVNSADQFGYTILFENMPTATAPAQVVSVLQTLDPALDFSTFQWTSFGWGDFRVSVPDDAIGSSFQTRVDATSTLGVFVDIDASLNLNTGQLSVVFTSIDPATGDIPIDPFLGFLPANLTAPEGDGFITYLIASDPGLPDGTQFDARATIIFDTEAPLDTPAIFNTLDNTAPSSAVTPFAFTTTGRNVFRVDWTSSDAPNGSGLAGTTILYSDNDGPLQSLTINNPGTAVRFVGEVGHTYKFFSIATDVVGNTEMVSTTPDAIITVISPELTPVGKKYTFTDEDGDLVTVTYGGPGTANLALIDAGNGRHRLDQVFVDGGDAKKSKLSISVKKKGGDGLLNVGDVNVNGGLASFKGTAVNLTVDGFLASGPVKSLTVRDVFRVDPLLADPALGGQLTQIAIGGTNVDKLKLSARSLADGISIATPGVISALSAASIGDGEIAAGALGSLTTTSGAMNADLTIAGGVGKITLKTGANSGIWTGAKFGNVTLGASLDADLTSGGDIGAVLLKSGSIAGDIQASGKIAKVTVKSGGVSGQLTATSFGGVTVTGGNLSGDLVATGAVGKKPTVGKLAITGGDLLGDVRLLGGAGAVSVKADKLGNGGNVSGVALTASKIAALTVAGNVTNATVLAGTDLGADGTPGGLGADADTFAAGTIGAIKIGGNATNSVFAAGLSNPDGIFNNDDDTFVASSPSASKIAALIVKGSDISGSYLAAATFGGRPSVGGAAVQFPNPQFRTAN